MFAKMHKPLHQKGDTIVEVLLSIAIVASVLAVTYSIMNRNLLTTRNNQERIEATKLLQGQIEGLRNLNNNSPASIPAANTTFCIRDNGTVQTGICTSGLYRLSIVSSNNVTFRFTASWDRLGSGAAPQIVMVYRR